MKTLVLFTVVVVLCVPPSLAGSDLLRAFTGAGEEWQVYFLEAPLAKAKVGDVFGDLFDAYHAGLGFRHKSTKKEFMYEFNAKGGLNMQKVLPQYESQSEDVVYRKDGEIITHTKIEPYEEPYWTKYTPIASVSDEQLERFQYWVHTYQKTPPEYQIFGVRSGSREVIKSHTCYDFVFTCISALDKIGVKFTVSSVKRFVFDLNVQQSSLRRAEEEDENAFWAYVYKAASHAKLVKENLSDALRKIAEEVSRIKEKHGRHPRLYYRINNQPISFKLEDKSLVAGYHRVPIPPKGDHEVPDEGLSATWEDA